MTVSLRFDAERTARVDYRYGGDRVNSNVRFRTVRGTRTLSSIAGVDIRTIQLMRGHACAADVTPPERDPRRVAESAGRELEAAHAEGRRGRPECRRRNTFELLFRDGTAAIVPRILVRESAGVPVAMLRDVGVSPDGDAICSRSMDVDVDVRGLLKRAATAVRDAKGGSAAWEAIT